MRIFQLGFLRIFEKIISQNHIFFFEEKWLILAGKRGDVSVWSLTSKTEYHICRSYAPHERGTLPQLAADCGCCQNLSHSYPRTWYSRVRSCEQSGFSALNHYNKEAMWNPLEYGLAYGVICWLNILVSQSLYSSWEWASILVGIEPPWFCLGDICENRHILSSPCRISGAIAGFARYACSHIIAEAKQVYMEWLILHRTVGSTVSRLFTDQYFFETGIQN